MYQRETINAHRIVEPAVAIFRALACPEFWILGGRGRRNRRFFPARLGLQIISATYQRPLTGYRKLVGYLCLTLMAGGSQQKQFQPLSNGEIEPRRVIEQFTCLILIIQNQSGLLKRTVTRRCAIPCIWTCQHWLWSGQGRRLTASAEPVSVQPYPTSFRAHRHRARWRR